MSIVCGTKLAVVLVTGENKQYSNIERNTTTLRGCMDESGVTENQITSKTEKDSITLSSVTVKEREGERDNSECRMKREREDIVSEFDVFVAKRQN